MPNIYDNIDQHSEEGLTKTLSNTYRKDFLIGYFNLREWEMVSGQVDAPEGGYLDKNADEDYDTRPERMEQHRDLLQNGLEHIRLTENEK